MPQIDANGILNVSARDKATAKQQNITITASSGLAKDDVEKMVREAEAHAADDKAQREAIDAKNRADQMVYQTEKELEERTAWALRLQEDARVLAHQVALFRMSRWVRLGRKIGLGPAL
jgi:molecular chaperone DnaK (HSP70)